MNNLSGYLDPTEVATVEIEFKAIKQEKFVPEIYVEVQDIEGMG